MKIFVSYSRNDGADFADYIKEYYEKEEIQVFVDHAGIKTGEDWSKRIRKAIAESDIVVVIITRSALKSSEVEKEVFEARNQKKVIIPCIYFGITWNELKWDFNKLHGINFNNKNSLVRQLHEIVFPQLYRKSISSKPIVSVPPNEATAAAVFLVTAIQGVRKFIPFEIERYSYARFPDKVNKNDIIPLEVSIKSFRPQSRFKNITLIKLKVDNESQKEIPVQVIVECDDDGFEIVGKYYTTVNVPIELKNSIPIIFNVKSKKEGLHTIHIRFYQQETFVGDIKIESVVIDRNTNLIPKSQSKIKTWKSISKLPNKIISGPDITLFIQERKISSDFEYEVLIYSLDIPMEEMGPIKFPFNPETKFHKIFEDIENLSGNPDIINRKIKAKGMSLYDELFPEKLKKLYWEKHDRIKSIRVISKEPWIPWEIIKPWRKLENGEIKEDPFLSENYAFSRWVVGKTERFKERIKSVKVVVPNDTNLAAAIKERNWIEEFAKDKNIKISLDSSYDQVINTLETEKEIDILHFSTHGQSNKESPLLSSIELEGKVQLQPEEIVGKTMTFGRSHPIVILNACQTGNQGFSLTGIQGWATKFLDAGASVFIGTLWSVNDETAFNFVKEFYNQLASGVTLGESIKNARNKCKKEGDTSWLAYQLYGHPNCTIKF